jgi:hypothetical protein
MTAGCSGRIVGTQEQSHESSGFGVLRELTCAVLLISLWQFGAAKAARAGDLVEAWLVPSLERVSREGPAGKGSSLTIHAARGECESFQVAVRAGRGGPPAVGLTVRPPASSALSLYREHFVEVRPARAVPVRGNPPLGPGWYADALIPLEPSRAEDGRGLHAEIGIKGGTEVFWIDVCPEAEARAGKASMPVIVRAGEAEFSFAVELNVWDFSLPAQPALDSVFRVATKSDAVRRELLKNRLMPLHTSPLDAPGLIDGYGLKSASLGYWTGADGKHCKFSPPPKAAAVLKEASYYDQRLHLYNYSADEIDGCRGQAEKMKAWARALHAAGVDNMVTMKPTPALYDDGSGSGRSAVDIWVLLPEMHVSAGRRVQEVLAKGDKVWSYNALIQDEYSPKWQIDFDPINFRIQPGFMNFRLGLTGLLYWQVDRWTKAPWSDVLTYTNGQYDFHGEGMLVYPALAPYSKTVAPSMRLKWLRDGVDDYDYFAILKRYGCTSQATAMADPVARSWQHWSKDGRVLARQRVSLGDYVERVVRNNGACS